MSQVLFMEFLTFELPTSFTWKRTSKSPSIQKTTKSMSSQTSLLLLSRPLLIISLLLLLLHVVTIQAQPKRRNRIASSVVYSWEATRRIDSPMEALPTDWVSSFFHKVNFTLISAGRAHSVAVGQQDGETTIYAWGNNDSNQLGDETSISRSLPTNVNSFGYFPVVRLSCGHNHNLILRKDGKLYAWGLNNYGQLGDRTLVNRNSPVPVFMDGALSGAVITQISAGASHSLALANNGSIFAWGHNFSGQLGIGTTKDSFVPVAVNMSALSGKVVIQIAASTDHSVALTSDGTVYYWGDKDIVGGSGSKEGPLIPVAVNMSGVGQGKRITHIAVGYFHTVMLTNDSQIYSWGSNTFGQLGSSSSKDSLEPVAVEMNGDLSGKIIVQIAAGGYHTLALTSDGRLYGWGKTKNGQLGGQTYKNHYVPTFLDINDELDDSITQIVAGEDHTMILTRKAKSYSMGKNEDGQLGDGTITYQYKPIAIGMNGVLNGKIIKNIVARRTGAQAEQYVALTQDGGIYSWGSNNAGEVGDGTRISKRFPVMVDRSGILNERIITQVALGVSFIVARSEDGMLYAWGTNQNGQLGDSSNQERPLPVAVFTGGKLRGKTMTSVSAESAHVVALANDGTMYAWGFNAGGALGDGTSINRRNPASVYMDGDLRGKRVVQVAAGASYSVALASDGTLCTWGFNKCGMRGDNILQYVSVPATVELDSRLKNITHIAARDYHTTILTEDGHIYSWGLTDFGAPVSFNNLPVQVSMNGLLNGKTVSQLAVNDHDMLALTSDGGLGYWNFESNYSTWVSLNKLDPKQTVTSLFIGMTTMGFLGVTCEPGYFGKDCDLFNCYDIEPKDKTRVCSGNGACIDLDTCKCNEGYTGMNCSYPICHGYSNLDTKVCSSHGTCRGPNKCVCEHGYHGDMCASNLQLLWTLVILGALLCVSLVVTIIVVGILIRRRRRDDRMKSELRACLLEEMSDCENTSFERGDFYIDMRDIKLISRISEGAFGVVFKGEWKSNAVAVKKMKVSDDESFVREVSILQSLRHPNILYLYGYSSNDSGDKFLITEFAVNGSLDKILHSSNATLKPFDQKMNILCQIADTMAYLHGRSPRIVHRDLKPQNILLGDNYHVRICDFGLSKITDTSFTMGKSYGTMEYCAPELLTHQEHDEKCDVYSFGIIMHEIFILDAPYSQHSYSSIFTLGLDIVRGLRPSIPSNSPQSLLDFFSKSNTTNIPSSEVPAVVQDFYSLATRCWDADTTKRPSFEEITTELDNIKKRSEKL